MRKSEKIRYLLLGMLVAFVMGQFIIPAGAAVASKMISVSSGVNVYLNDAKLDTRDANGNPVSAFIYNGTTYLPLRAVAQALGQTVQWDGKTYSVYLGKHTGQKPAVWLKDLDYFNKEGHMYNTGTQKDNLGNSHTDCLTAYEYSEFSYTYKLNAKYSRITGILFKNFEFRSNTFKGTLRIYGDGDLLYEASINNGMEPIPFSVDLTGVLELKVEFDSNSIFSENLIGDCGLWT